jgi:phage shock protein A
MQLPDDPNHNQDLPIDTETNIDPFDLSGMSLQAAKEYVAVHLHELKQVETQMKTLEDDLSTWQNRVVLAKSKGEEQLAEKAMAKVEVIQVGYHQKKREYQELSITVDRLKERLKNKNNEFQHTVDSDSLLMQLEELAGKPSEEMQLEKNLNHLDVNSKLEAMKQRLASKSNQKESVELEDAEDGTDKDDNEPSDGSDS